jgi:hypothetical protein
MYMGEGQKSARTVKFVQLDVNIFDKNKGELK